MEHVVVGLSTMVVGMTVVFLVLGLLYLMLLILPMVNGKESNK